MKIACFTDIHNQSGMLNLPTILRRSGVQAAEQVMAEWGQADLALMGGDYFSDYPYWNRSCALPYKNWLDIKQKLTDNFARCAKGGKVLYVSGNNDLLIGDLPTKDNPPYNTCDFYRSGPMKETLGVLAKGEYIGKYAKSKGRQAGLYHLAFHYRIDGVDFFGLNIDPDEAFNNHDCCFDVKSLVWLKEKLRAVDPEGNKLIFVVGHVNATSRRGDGRLVQGMDDPRRLALIDAFAGHKNLFYLYGHVHGEQYLRKKTEEGILHFDEAGAVTDAENAAFHTVHMGGLRPFKAANFEKDGLTRALPGAEAQYDPCTGTPKIAQYLLMETFADRVEFAYRNTGSLEGFTPEDRPEPYTVFLK